MTRSRFIAPALADGDTEPWQLVIPGAVWRTLTQHLFPGDGMSMARSPSPGSSAASGGTRLLIRDVFLARNGQDFVQAQNAHRRLTPEFVNRHIRHCRDQHLAYLAIHNHGSTDWVAFSGVDIRSHERGYPALLDNRPRTARRRRS